MEGVACCSHCIQDVRRVMWSMLTGNEAACTCLYNAFSRGCQLVVRNVVKYIVIMRLCGGAPLV